jgi:peptidyl-prolyl cis-trans isomerase SurA
MKRWFFLILLFSYLTPQEKIDEIVAIVGDEVILKSEVEERTLFIIQQLAPDMTEEEVRRKVLENLINEKLLLIEAKKDTAIKVEEEEIEKYFEEQWEQWEKELGKERLQAELEKEGLTPEALKKNIRDQLYVQKLIEMRIKPKISVTPDEVRKFYEEYKDSIPERPTMVRLSHILVLIRPKPEAEKEAEEKANILYEKLKSGEDFATLALRFSDDRTTAELGGDLGYLRKTDLPPSVADVIFALEPGDISEPIRGDFSYYIFKCEEKGEDVIRLRQIVINVKLTKEDSLLAKDKAEDYMKKIREGYSFTELAKRYSDDPNSRDFGGDLGWIPLDQLPESIKVVVEGMKPGDIKGPVLSLYGYHILKLDDRKEGAKPTFEEIQDELSQILFQRKLDEAINKLVSKIRERVYVEIKG